MKHMVYKCTSEMAELIKIYIKKKGSKNCMNLKALKGEQKYPV